MALISSDVNAGDDILASHHNGLIDDMEQHTHDGTDTTKIDFTANPEIRYISLTGVAFHGLQAPDTEDKGTDAGAGLVNNDAAYAARFFVAQVNFPNGATVIEWTMYYYRDDAAAVIDADLIRQQLSNNSITVMLDATGTTTGGDHSVTDSSVTGGTATIDNTAYTYYVKIQLDPNNAFTDVKLYGFSIKYTITKPLP